MKKKELKKIFKKSLIEFKNKTDRKERLKYAIEPVSNNHFNDYMFSESVEENKSHIRNMIFRLLTLRDQLSINITDDRISISSDYGLKPYKNSSSYQSSDYFHLDIINKTGYLLNFKDKRVAYRDVSLYDDIVDNIRKIFEDLNNRNFEELYNEIMIESGLARESNLDDLLKG